MQDVVRLDIQAGERVVVCSDVHLGPQTTDASAFVSARLTELLDDWAGPGAVVLNGDILDLIVQNQPDVTEILRANRRLIASLKAFAEGEDHRLVYIVGNHDSRLAWDEKLAFAVRDAIGCEFALTCDLVFQTARRITRIPESTGPTFICR